VTSGIDLWRAVDPEARLLSGSVDRLRAAVRGVARSRAAPPHLPDDADGQLLIIDVALLGPETALDRLVGVLGEAGLQPAAVLLAALQHQASAPDRAGDPLPILGSAFAAGPLADAATRHLEHADAELARIMSEVRLAAAEAALANPDPAAAAGLVAARLRRGVAVSADGELRALHARPAGRTLAARFAALHTRLLAGSPGRGVSRQTAEGLFLLERQIRPGASVWLFDDLPFARVDEAAAEALTITLRALLRRPAEARSAFASRPLRRDPAYPATARPPTEEPAGATSPDATLEATLLAVARANGRVASAARELGVHRNTVLYRLRRASGELGVDPRRADDALAILRRAEDSG
jgi:PucR-like helix-turn-helix protein